MNSLFQEIFQTNFVMDFAQKTPMAKKIENKIEVIFFLERKNEWKEIFQLV